MFLLISFAVAKRQWSQFPSVELSGNWNECWLSCAIDEDYCVDSPVDSAFVERSEQRLSLRFVVIEVNLDDKKVQIKLLISFIYYIQLCSIYFIFSFDKSSNPFQTEFERNHFVFVLNFSFVFIFFFEEDNSIDFSSEFGDNDSTEVILHVFVLICCFSFFLSFRLIE